MQNPYKIVIIVITMISHELAILDQMKYKYISHMKNIININYSQLDLNIQYTFAKS